MRDQCIEALAERGPGNRMFQIALGRQIRCLDLFSQRAQRIAFAKNFQGHALFEVRQRATVDI